MQRLGAPRGARAELKDMVNALASSGRLMRVGARRFTQPTAEEVCTGTLTVTRRGFGFLSREDGLEDLYVNGSQLGTAMHRDRVQCQIALGPRGREEGRVIKVLERGTHTFVGVVHQARKAQWITPRDERLPDRIRLIGDARHGEMVAAQFVNWPDRGGQLASAKVLKAFAKEGVASDETAMIVYDLGLPVEFSEDAVAEAAAYGDCVDPEEVARRVDLRDLALITVDPQSARDYDDAVHAKRLDSGGWQLTVAIADVAHYVRPGTALDDDALDRAQSVYLPDRVLPMLPDQLSADLCSLRPHVDRLAMIVRIHVTPQGGFAQVELLEAVICSHARLSYDRAARLVGLHPDDDASVDPTDAAEKAAVPTLRALVDVTRVLRNKRKKRGYLSLEIGEPSVVLDSEGNIDRVSITERHEAHLMVEEAMLAANVAVAKFFVRRDEDTMFRTHGEPPPDALERFRKQAGSLDVDIPNTSDAGHLTKALQRHAEHPMSWLLNMLVLRAMARAEYVARVEPHFGLGLDAYLHFTSPIRRYPDLVVHRMVKAVIHETETVDDDALVDVARHCSRKERIALDAERDVIGVYKALLMSRYVGTTLQATVMALTPNGMFLRFPLTLCEGFIPVEELNDDWYALNDEGTFLVGEKTGHQYRLGDELKVEIKDVSVRRRRVTACLPGNADRANRPRR